MWLSPPLPTLKHYSSVGPQASPPGSFHYWVALNLTSLPPSTTSISHAKLPKESEPCTHTHTCTHTRTYVLPPLTMETPRSRDLLPRPTCRGGPRFGSKRFEDPRHGGRRGLAPLGGSPLDLKLVEEGQKPWEVGRRRKSRAGRMLFADLSLLRFPDSTRKPVSSLVRPDAGSLPLPTAPF